MKQLGIPKYFGREKNSKAVKLSLCRELNTIICAERKLSFEDKELSDYIVNHETD